MHGTVFMMSSIEQTFYELFYGSGIWLGILLLLAIVTGLSMRFKYAGLLCLPVTIFIGIDYITNSGGNQNLLWASIIMFFTSIFLVINLMRESKS